MRALACAILFLTRLPLPQLALEERDYARSPGYFAWVGALIAVALWGTAQLAPAAGLRLTALLVVAVWVLITGGLHLDGLADTIDGLSGGRGERARTLEIMRDSRIGAHGALALVLVLALKWAALERALELGQSAWLIAPVGARFVGTSLIAFFPYARDEGLGRPFVAAADRGALLLSASALLSCGWLLGPLSLLAAFVGAACALAFALYVQRRLAGLTGDVYGAAIELAELGTLLSLPALR